MSGKAKLVLLLVLVALVYYVVSGGSEPVEVDIEE
jgi:hypothetical protein